MKRKTLNVVPVVLVMVSMLASAGDTEALVLKGRVVVDVVDAQRVVVAVDSNRDGNVECLFLYTASERLRTTPRMNMPGEVQYQEGGFLLVKLANGAKTLRFSARPEFGTDDADVDVIRFDRSAGLSQYVPASPLSIKDLESKRVTADCAITPAGCVEVAGQLLPFPA